MHIDHDYALRNAVTGNHAEGLSQLAIKRLHDGANKATVNLAFVDELRDNRADHVGGNRKSNTNIAAAGCKYGGIDANQPSIQVHQGAAGVTRVDGRIGLNKVLVPLYAQPTSSQRADDTRGHGLVETKGVADGHHEVSHPQLCTVRVCNGDQVFRRHL